MADQLVFQGVGYIEGQDRYNEHRTGVPAQGAGAILQTAQTRRTTKVFVVNSGEHDVHARLRHQGTTKTQTNENLTALAQSATVYSGALQYKSIVPGSVSFTNAGAPPTIVDDGQGNLYDMGFVGVAANLRGTINYALGTFTLTYGAAPTQPVRATYQHTDAVDFASALQTTTKAAGALPYTIQSGFGRVNPGSVTLTDGTRTWIDDGKGNIIETVGASAIVKAGTIDYATGIVTLTAGDAPVGTVTYTYTFNPFAGLVVKAAGCKLLDLMGESQLPELTTQAWAAGIKNETTLSLWGETRDTQQSNLVCQWFFFGEDPYRVTEVFSGFPPGGDSNDSRNFPRVPV